jgi:hypothetical protein
VETCGNWAPASSVVRRLLALETLDGGSDTTDLNWVGEHGIRHPIRAEPFEAATLEDWFRPSAGHPGPQDGQSWTVPGWWARATAWITNKVQAARLGRALAIEQIRAWEFSCVLRVHTDLEDLYFKALPRSYAREPRLAQYLAAGAPLSAWEGAAAGCAELQFGSTGHAPRLLALGCRLRGRSSRPSSAETTGFRLMMPLGPAPRARAQERAQ